MLEGDILNKQGKPFTSMPGAITAQAKAGDTHEIARVAGGLVVRPIKSAPGAQLSEDTNVQDTTVGADTQAGQAPTEKAQDLGSDAAATQDLPGAGSVAVEGSGVKAGDWIKPVVGSDMRPRQIDSIGDDGWVYTKSGDSFKPGQFEPTSKPVPTPITGGTGREQGDMPSGNSSTQAPADNAEWTRMPHAERNALTAKTGMSKLVADKIARTPWAEITAKTRARIEAAMTGPVSDTQTADEAKARARIKASTEAIASDAQAADAPVASKPAKAKKQDKTRGPRLAAYDKNPLMTFIATHGLYHEKDQPGSLKSEFSPDKGIMVPGYGPVFKKNGKRLDTLVQNAIEDGYLPKDGTEQQLYSLIQRAVAGEKITPKYAQGVAESEAQAQMDARAELEQEQQADDNSEPATADEIEAAHDTVSELSDAELFALDDDIPWDAPSNSSTEAFLRAMGAPEQEIQDGIAQEQGIQSQSNQGSTGAQEVVTGPAQAGNGGRGTQAGDSVTPRPGGSDSEGLTAPTRDDVLAQQERADKAAKAEAQAATDAANKAKADAERNEFTLTGSDRPADVGAAGGQEDIFSQPEKPAATEAAAKPAFGASNTLVTLDMRDKIKARMKAKLGRLNTGIDPELLADGIQLGVFHLEAGVRSFVDFAKAVAADLDTPVSSLKPLASPPRARKTLSTRRPNCGSRNSTTPSPPKWRRSRRTRASRRTRWKFSR